MPTLATIIGTGTSTANAADVAAMKADIAALKLSVARKTDIKTLEDAIALLEAADKTQLVTVTHDHHPADAEIDGSWGLWRSQIPAPPNVKLNFHLWLGGQYSYALIPEDIEMPWESLAVLDPLTKTYSIPIEGVKLEYNKTLISSLGNQFFGQPSLVFRIKDANTVFSNIGWKAQNNTGREIGNGGGVTVQGETLTVIQVNPAMAGGESTVVAKVIFEFTRLNGTKFNYEIKI